MLIFMDRYYIINLSSQFANQYNDRLRLFKNENDAAIMDTIRDFIYVIIINDVLFVVKYVLNPNNHS